MLVLNLVGKMSQRMAVVLLAIACKCWAWRSFESSTRPRNSVLLIPRAQRCHEFDEGASKIERF